MVLDGVSVVFCKNMIFVHNRHGMEPNIQARTRDPPLVPADILVLLLLFYNWYEMFYNLFLSFLEIDDSMDCCE